MALLPLTAPAQSVPPSQPPRGVWHDWCSDSDASSVEDGHSESESDISIDDAALSASSPLFDAAAAAEAAASAELEFAGLLSSGDSVGSGSWASVGVGARPSDSESSACLGLPLPTMMFVEPPPLTQVAGVATVEEEEEELLWATAADLFEGGGGSSVSSTAPSAASCDSSGGASEGALRFGSALRSRRATTSDVAGAVAAGGSGGSSSDGAWVPREVLEAAAAALSTPLLDTVECRGAGRVSERGSASGALFSTSSKAPITGGSTSGGSGSIAAVVHDDATTADPGSTAPPSAAVSLATASSGPPSAVLRSLDEAAAESLVTVQPAATVSVLAPLGAAAYAVAAPCAAPRAAVVPALSLAGVAAGLPPRPPLPRGSSIRRFQPVAPLAPDATPRSVQSQRHVYRPKPPTSLPSSFSRASTPAMHDAASLVRTSVDGIGTGAGGARGRLALWAARVRLLVRTSGHRSVATSTQL